MIYVSFDVANKSLAVSIIKYIDTDTLYAELANAHEIYKEKKRKFLKTDPLLVFKEYINLLQESNQILSKRIKIEYLHVVDLIPNKKISESSIVERTFNLRKYLDSLRAVIDPLIKDDDYKFLIEYQMGPNDKSRAVSSQILLFCSSFAENVEDAEARIKLVGPSLKNKLSIDTDEKSHHSYYLSKFKTNYAANKNHTKYLLYKIVDTYNQNNILLNIKKKNIDDAADAVCMTIAYISKYDC